MREHPIDLYVCLLMSLLLMITVSIDVPHSVRMASGLPFLLLAPGYVAVFALFPETGRPGRGISFPDRVALSLGLSVALIPLTGILLAYSPWGFRSATLIPSLLMLTGAMGLIGFERWIRLPPQDRFTVGPSIRQGHNEVSARDVLPLILVIAIVAPSALILGLLGRPPDGGFTELFILDVEGGTREYPSRLSVNRTKPLIIRVSNFEGRETTYFLEAWLIDQTLDDDGIPRYQWGRLLDRANITLPPTGSGAQRTPQWETEYYLLLDQPGTYRVVFLLNIEPPEGMTKGSRCPGEVVEERVESAYRLVHLWVQVESQ